MLVQGKKNNFWNSVNISAALDRKSDCTSIIETCGNLKRNSVGSSEANTWKNYCVPEFTCIVFLICVQESLKGHFTLMITVDHKIDRGLPTHTPTEQQQHFPSTMTTGFYIS